MFYPDDDHDDEMVEPQITHEEIALLYTTLQTVCNQYAIPVNLDALNAAHARVFVENIQQPEPFHINNWLTSYKQALLEKIKTQLGDTKPNALFPATTIKNTAIESYSYLFHMSLIQDNKESFARFFTKLGDAHAFIQATGFSTQNETSYLAWLDLYNYWRSADYIAENKFTLKENVYSNRTRIGRPIFSIITVPFKVREAQDNKPQFVATGVKNAGINIGLLNWKTDRYFANQTVSSHKISFGAIIAPSGEELNIDNTDGQILTKSTQLFIATGLTATYTYNSISFVAIPIGYDFATTSDGRKWMYNQKWWWGFGIGIDTKLLGF